MSQILDRPTQWFDELDKERKRNELAVFGQYVADRQRMSRREFYEKYQDYLGLTYEQLARIKD